MYIIGNIKALDKYNKKQIKTMFIGVFISICFFMIGLEVFGSKIDVHILFSFMGHLGIPINNLNMCLSVILLLIFNPILIIGIIGMTLWFGGILLLFFAAFMDDDAKYII